MALGPHLRRASEKMCADRGHWYHIEGAAGLPAVDAKIHQLHTKLVLLDRPATHQILVPTNGIVAEPVLKPLLGVGTPAARTGTLTPRTA